MQQNKKFSYKKRTTTKKTLSIFSICFIFYYTKEWTLLISYNILRILPYWVSFYLTWLLGRGGPHLTFPANNNKCSLSIFINFHHFFCYIVEFLQYVERISSQQYMTNALSMLSISNEGSFSYKWYSVNL